MLEARSLLYNQIREFFRSRNVLEIETPILTTRTVTDVNIDSITVGQGVHTNYLHTSPEYAMKRLLVDFQRDIYQLCKVFRAEDEGKYHHCEFTMLEWYRVTWDYKKLMYEVETLVKKVIEGKRSIFESEFICYKDAFKKYCMLDPLTAKLDDYKQACSEANLSLCSTLKISEYQDLLLNQVIAPMFDMDRLTFVYDFPVEHAALARISQENFAQRFEVFWGQMELANGFQELTDAEEQLARFEKDNQKRLQIGKSEMVIDEKFIDSLNVGLPECSGVALGIDRLLMMTLNLSDIKDVLVFPNA